MLRPPFALLAALALALCPAAAVLHTSHAPEPPAAHRLPAASLQLDILPRVLPPASGGRRTAGSKRALVPPLQHELGWDDEFRVALSLPGREESVVLHLAPTPNLLHPAASSRSSPSLPSTPLSRDSLLAYAGYVLPAGPLSDVHWSASALHARRAVGDAGTAADRPEGAVGWARVVVADPARGTLQGGFSVDGEEWHVLPSKVFDLHYPSSSSPSTAADNDDTPHDPSTTPEDPSLVLFRDADVRKPSSAQMGCTHDTLPFNTDPAHAVRAAGAHRRRLGGEGAPWWAGELGAEGLFDGGVSFGREGGLQRRQDAGGSLGGDLNFTSTIGQRQGCPTSAQVVYTGVAADCAYVRRYGGADEARTQILSNWNQASAVFRSTFNISLGIVELYVPSSTNSSCTPTPATPAEGWNVDCSSLTLNDRLSAFSRWRGAERVGDEAGLWHLMSGCPTGSEVGVAWLGLLCEQGARDQGAGGTVSGTAVSTFSPVEWQVVTHETAHNFGAVHDCTASTCGSGDCCPLSTATCDAGGQFIMSPVSQEGEEQFSQCTVGNVCSALQRNIVDSSCVQTPGQVATIAEGQCGNGILDPGEECDPGGRESACCDASTCRFRDGAQCDPSSSPCCQDSCTFSPASTVCRPSVGECDVEDLCTGSSADCPEDETVADGTSCSGPNNSTISGLSCASGVCTSRDLQCATVGASLGITRACPNGLSTGESCTLTCANPRGGASCLSLQSSFVDGTSCGGGQGRCSNGRCSYGSGLARAKGWYLDHLNIAVPVTVVVGLIVLALLFFILRALYRCCTGRPQRAPRPSRRGRGAAAAARPFTWGNDDSQRSSAQTVGSGQPFMQQRGPPGFVPNYQQQQPSFPPASYAPPPARGQWVDPSAYNGPNYRGQ